MRTRSCVVAALSLLILTSLGCSTSDKAEVAGLKEQVDDVTTEVAGLKTELATLKAEVARFKAERPSAKGGRATVVGKVTFKGVPLPSGIVTFIPHEGKPVTAAVTADGSYKATGVPYGKVRVTVAALPTLPAPTLPIGIPPATGPLLPAKYASPKTTLTTTIDRQQQKYDIALTD